MEKRRKKKEKRRKEGKKERKTKYSKPLIITNLTILAQMLP